MEDSKPASYSVRIYYIYSHVKGKQLTKVKRVTISSIFCTTSFADLLPANSYINPLPDGPLCSPLSDSPRSDWT